MRILPSDEHQARKEKMLQAVVHLYIRTGKPVGSSTIAENYKLNLSAATIRNVLAELERRVFNASAYLRRPHPDRPWLPVLRGFDREHSEAGRCRRTEHP
jgi:heat-inducible transcriptional repressor